MGQEDDIFQREQPRLDDGLLFEDVEPGARDPALLEYVGRNAFQASIYPIPPGGERRVEFERQLVVGAQRQLHRIEQRDVAPALGLELCLAHA